MAKAETNIPWLALCEVVARVTRYLCCMPEDAELRIAGKTKAGRIKACGVTSEGYEVSPLPAAWGGMIDWDAGSLSRELTNVKLCCIDLIAAGLLPAPAERARWLAAEAIAYLVKGVPLPWKEWQRAGAAPAAIEQAEIDLGQVISEGVPAWGWHPRKRKRKRIPSDHFRDERIKKKAVPVSVAHLPKVSVDCAGSVTTSPRQRFADYQGPHWEAVEVDAAALRRARPRPLTAQAEPTAIVAAVGTAAKPPQPPKGKGGRPPKQDRLLVIMSRIRLKAGLPPATVRMKVRARLRSGETASPRTIARAYQKYHTSK